MLGSLGFFAILVLTSCLGQVSSDLYLPSLPAIRDSLHTTDGLTQWSISVFMLGYSLSQLIYGPVSDAIGRRKPLLFGLALCTLAGFLCMYAHTITILILGRLLQGLGAGAGMALSRSMMRDRYQGGDLAAMGSYLGITNVFIMASAPVIGGYVQSYFGWRTNFMILFLYALLALITVMFGYTESNRHIDPNALSRKTLKHNSSTLLRHRNFMGYSLCTFFAYAGVSAWITTGPILLITKLGISPIHFGWTAIMVGASFLIGGVCNALVVKRFGHLNMMRFGIGLMFLAGISMLSFGLLDYLNYWVIIVPLFGFLFGSAFIFPNSFAGALTPFATIAGMAGAAFGFLQILGGSLSSFLMSYLPSNSQVPMSLVFTSYAIIAALISFLLLKNSDELS